MGEKAVAKREFPHSLSDTWIMGGELKVFIIGKSGGQVKITITQPSRLIDCVCLADHKLGGQKDYGLTVTSHQYLGIELSKWKLVVYDSKNGRLVVRRVEQEDEPQQLPLPKIG